LVQTKVDPNYAILAKRCTCTFFVKLRTSLDEVASD